MPVHISVMPDEIVHWLVPLPGQTIIDGTLGAGGHTRLLAERVSPDGRIIAVDRDPAAVAAAEVNLKGLPVLVAHASYAEMAEVLAEVGTIAVQGMVLDLGLSSDQLAAAERGFSFHAEGPLDMRFDTSTGEPAWRWLQRVRAEELADIIFKYGEERFSRRIARAIVEQREEHSPFTAVALAQLVSRCVPRGEDRIHPATRTFQAIRIAINRELEELERCLRLAPTWLAPGGRLAILSFHSLEDRIVKEAFRDDARWRALTKKPILPTEQEIAGNPRSRSAKLRVAERVDAC